MHDVSVTTQSYQPTTATQASRTTLISRLSSHVFSIVFFISIYTRFDKNAFRSQASADFSFLSVFMSSFQNLFVCRRKILDLNALNNNSIIIALKVCPFLPHLFFISEKPFQIVRSVQFPLSSHERWNNKIMKFNHRKSIPFLNLICFAFSFCVCGRF